MRFPFKAIAGAMTTLVLVGACVSDHRISTPTSPGGTSALVITSAKSVWTWEEVVSTGIRATLRNSTSRALESALGDKFNDAMEQPDLFIARGSNGLLEREDPDGVWRPAALSSSFEAFKRVTLRPGQSYSLTVLLREQRQTGVHRIRVTYYDSPGGSTGFSDYSEPFEIR